MEGKGRDTLCLTGIPQPDGEGAEPKTWGTKSPGYSSRQLLMMRYLLIPWKRQLLLSLGCKTCIHFNIILCGIRGQAGTP